MQIDKVRVSMEIEFNDRRSRGLSSKYPKNLDMACASERSGHRAGRMGVYTVLAHLDMYDRVQPFTL